MSVSVTKFCIIANSQILVKRVISSLSTDEFECKGIYSLNGDLFELLTTLNEVPDILFIENSRKVDSIKRYLRSQHQIKSIVYLQLKEKLIPARRPVLQQGETFLIL